MLSSLWITNVLYIMNNYMAGVDCVSTGSSLQDVCGIIRYGYTTGSKI